jgi:hypothetical protein
MPKVFIPNKGAHDFSDSERYGEIVFVTNGIQNRYSIGSMARVWAHSFLSNKATKDDLILITSLTILNCIGCAIFATRFGTLNLLLYRNDKYLKRSIILSQVFEELTTIPE